jgi:hypothetical protein
MTITYSRLSTLAIRHIQVPKIDSFTAPISCCQFHRTSNVWTSYVVANFSSNSARSFAAVWPTYCGKSKLHLMFCCFHLTLSLVAQSTRNGIRPKTRSKNKHFVFYLLRRRVMFSVDLACQSQRARVEASRRDAKHRSRRGAAGRDDIDSSNRPDQSSPRELSESTKRSSTQLNICGGLGVVNIMGGISAEAVIAGF